MKNKIVNTHTDKEGNVWERRVMTNSIGEKYAVLYKNGKKVVVLGRILKVEKTTEGAKS